MLSLQQKERYMSNTTVEKSSAVVDVPKESVRTKRVPIAQSAPRPANDKKPLGSVENPIPPQPLPASDFAVKLFIREGIYPPTDQHRELYDQHYGHMRNRR
jgi:hypothetical protein